MSIPKRMLGLAATFAAASELCKRDFRVSIKGRGNKIAVETTHKSITAIVRSKQRRVWPNCTGVHEGDEVLIFVDFENKKPNERPDFYILTAQNWKKMLYTELESDISEGEVIIDEKNVPVWPQQICKNGNLYKGMSVKPEQIMDHREQWEKIRQLR